MFAVLAVVLFAIATLVAFTSLSGVSIIGLIAAGLLCLALGAVVPWAPWRS